MNDLEGYISQASLTPYTEGQHDCATFVAGWVDLVTGSDFKNSLCRYRTIFEGLRNLAPNGIGERVAAELLAAGWKFSMEGRPGDIAILDNNTAAILGPDGFVCSIPLGMTGLVKIHPRHARNYFTPPIS